MYYEEKWESGELWWRGTPNGEWHRATYETVSQRCQAAEELVKRSAYVWQPPADCVAWPVGDQTLVWAECEHNGEKHKAPFWIAPGTLLAGHPNMLRKAGAVQPQPASQCESETAAK